MRDENDPNRDTIAETEAAIDSLDQHAASIIDHLRSSDEQIRRPSGATSSNGPSSASPSRATKKDNPRPIVADPIVATMGDGPAPVAMAVRA